MDLRTFRQLLATPLAGTSHDLATCFRIVLLLALLPALSCVSKEKRAWESARAENSVAAYEAFLKRFPQSEFARQAEKQAWESARTENSVATYEAFLKSFPQSEFAPQASESLLDILPVIPFISERDGYMAVYTMRYDGSKQVRVSPSGEVCDMSVLSPDGRRIAYTSHRKGNAGIWVMNVDGTNRKRLANNPNDLAPDWSPDGQRIAFVSGRDGNFEIYVMNADGTHTVRLTKRPGVDLYPVWSPDGKRIAFTVHADGRKRVETFASTAVEDIVVSVSSRYIGQLDGDIYVMNADGSGIKPLVTGPGNDACAAWSEDGKRIFFTSDRNGNQDIFAVNLDGSGLKQLTHQAGIDRFPRVYPKMHAIIFTSKVKDNVDVWMMNEDGSQLRRLTVNPANDFLN